MLKTMKKFLQDESGASLIEYVLIAGVLSIVGYTVMALIGTDLSSILGSVNRAPSAAQTTAAGNAPAA